MPAAGTTSHFDPTTFETFRFLGRSLGADGMVSLRYALGDAHEFEERFVLPVPARQEADTDTVQDLLDLLHWVAGVSYYKAAAPPAVSFAARTPPPQTAALLEALYSEGLGEFAVLNGLEELPRPRFGTGGATLPRSDADRSADPGRVLVPVGGGKDSAVAIEIVRSAGIEQELFSVGDAKPIQATATVSGFRRLTAMRRLDPKLLELNAAGALNGHVPVTAIVSAAALLTAALNGFDAVALANERSASAPNTSLGGVDVNHQFSKGARAELLLRAAVSEIDGAPGIFSVLRPASELAIARAFARMPQYHRAFTSCNAIFRLDPGRRAGSWCGECDKCRFVFLVLAPFLDPAALRQIFGRAMLDDDRQYQGFALLTGTGGHKPFECVGEVEESVAAIRMLSRDARWRDQRVVARLTQEVLPRFNAGDGDPSRLFALSDDHQLPRRLSDAVHAVLGA
jgi:hypothetical protein